MMPPLLIKIPQVLLSLWCEKKETKFKIKYLFLFLPSLK